MFSSIPGNVWAPENSGNSRQGIAHRLALHPNGMAPRIINFTEWARHILEGLHAEILRNPDDQPADHTTALILSQRTHDAPSEAH